MQLERNESLKFNYSNVFFSYYFNNDRSCTQMVDNHALAYLYSGEMLVEEAEKQTTRVEKPVPPSG